jgi:hypothetical protein
MKKKLIEKITLVLIILFFMSFGFVYAEEITIEEEPASVSEELLVEPASSSFELEQDTASNADAGQEVLSPLVHLSIKDRENKAEVSDFPLPDEGMVAIQDSSGGTHDIDARSVLAVLHSWDQASPDFEMGKLIYYSSFNALYLRCISLQGEEKCDNWLYKVDGKSPSVGMDSFILDGGENIEIYFSSFWGKPDPEPEEVVEEEPSPEQEVFRSSGGGRRTKPERQEETIIDPAEEIPALAVSTSTFTPLSMSPEVVESVPEPEEEVIIPETAPTAENFLSVIASAEESGFSAGSLLWIVSLLAVILAAFLSHRKLPRQ